MQKPIQHAIHHPKDLTSKELNLGTSVAEVTDVVVWRVTVRARDVVFVKGILEASEGLASLFSDRGGDLTLVASASRAEEFEEMLGDLVNDVGAIVTQVVQRKVGS